MGLIEALREGTHGVSLRVPETWVLQNQDASSASLVDQEQGIACVCAGFSVGGKHSAVLTLITTPLQPIDQIVPELVDAAKTFEMSKRPWWKVW